MRLRPAKFLSTTFLLADLTFAGLRAGAAVQKITPSMDSEQPVYMAGFGKNRRATGIKDDLYSRCLAMSANGNAVVICAVDSIGLFFDDVEKIRAAVRAKWTKSVDVIITATHSHQTPDTMGLWGPSDGVSGIDEDYNAFVVQRTAGAALAALRGMRSARLHVAASHPPELDSFIDDNRPPIVHDAQMIVMRLARRSGATIATLINWANHPEALGSKNTMITPDFPATLCRDTESRLGGVTLFVNGALGGMQSPLGAKVLDPRTGTHAPPESFRFAEALGSRLADIALDAIRNAPRVKVSRVLYRETIVRIPVANQGFQLAAKANLYGGRKVFNEDSTTSSPVGLLRITSGKRVAVEAAAIPGELYPELSTGGTIRYPEADFPSATIEAPLKQVMTASYRMVFGLANDEIGYILPKAEWDEKPPYLAGASKRWYGEVNSVGPDAASVIADAFIKLCQGN